MSYGFQPPPYQGGPPGPGGFPPGAPPANGGYPVGGYQPNAPPPPYQQAAPQSAVIRNSSSGLCLDAVEYDVRLQYYNGSPTQQWALEPTGPNRYILRNKGSGAVLDIEGGPDCGAHLVTYECHGGLNQQWSINPDNTITSAAANLAIDVCEGTCFPGNVLIAYERHGGPNQQFNLQYV